ncbi:hypothetical protein QBC41DRAFT_338820 [Cercophora samala]|uniref:Uncharacterized protein n=1 Tax=Cercophora samala TaxID=330535 RepID=A0AA39Z9I0_9PEZI|nr:hypothetical protein QBC41DRAFT_338820 [Cercophora samala]
MTPTKKPPLALPKIPYLLWGIIEPLLALRDLFSPLPSLQVLHVRRLGLLQALFTLIIARSRDPTLTKRYLWAMLLISDLPWILLLILDTGDYLTDWEQMADNLNVVSPLHRPDKPSGSVLKADGTPMTDKELFLQERATGAVVAAVLCVLWFLLRFATVMGWFGRIGGRVHQTGLGGDTNNKVTDKTVFSQDGEGEVYTLSLDKEKVTAGVTVKIRAI